MKRYSRPIRSPGRRVATTAPRMEKDTGRTISKRLAASRLWIEAWFIPARTAVARAAAIAAEAIAHTVPEPRRVMAAAIIPRATGPHL